MRPALVCAHGISQHPAGYSDPWWEALRPHVGDRFGGGALGVDRFEVLWSDIVNKADRAVARDPGAEAEVALAKAEIEATLAERQLRYANPAEARSLQEGPAPMARGDGMSLDDFMRYMFSGDVRRQVLQRFYDVIAEVGNRSIHLISHSWGTVVAYEGLLQPRGGEVPGVLDLFTVGAALSIPFGRYKLSLRNFAPAYVRRWYNFDAKGDGVGSPLQRHFPMTRARLVLPVNPTFGRPDRLRPRRQRCLKPLGGVTLADPLDRADRHVDLRGDLCGLQPLVALEQHAGMGHPPDRILA